MSFIDRPASHATAHVENQPRPCGQEDPPGWHVTWLDLFWAAVLIAVIVILVTTS